MSVDNSSWQMFFKDRWLTAVLLSACLLDRKNEDMRHNWAQLWSCFVARASSSVYFNKITSLNSSYCRQDVCVQHGLTCSVTQQTFWLVVMCPTHTHEFIKGHLNSWGGPGEYWLVKPPGSALVLIYLKSVHMHLRSPASSSGPLPMRS